MVNKRPLWITILLWFILSGDSLLLIMCDGVHWFAAAILFLAQLLFIVQEIRGYSLISDNLKANTIGMLIVLLIEGFIFVLMIPTLV